MMKSKNEEAGRSARSEYAILIDEAFRAREKAYAPYSHYKVGAALMSENGNIYTGCNVENASYGLTNCAERTAIFKAVSEGETALLVIAIAGGEENAATLDMAYPCGACRQVMREFSDPGLFKVIVARSRDDYEVYTLKDLLPASFGPGNLGQ